jgi:hypothetical protein
MIYSVWNQGLGAFDYFEGAQAAPTQNAPKPAHLVSRTLGSTVDQAAWPLPAVVRKIGSGEQPVGRIAKPRGGRSLGADDASSPLVKAGLLALSAFLLWKYALGRPARRRT